jgi:hypothetical protein
MLWHNKATGFDEDDGQYRVSFQRGQSDAGGAALASGL